MRQQGFARVPACGRAMYHCDRDGEILAALVITRLDLLVALL